jgi:hypothetical protein
MILLFVLALFTFGSISSICTDSQKLTRLLIDERGELQPAWPVEYVDDDDSLILIILSASDMPLLL